MLVSKHSMRANSLVLATLALSLLACNKTENGATGPGGEGGIGNTPRTSVPQELVGMWLNGTVGFTNFYNPTTGQWSGGRGFGMFYKLNADGTFEYGWQGQVTNYNCTTRGMIYKKGTVVVNDSVLTFYDNYGRAMGEYSCAPGSNFDRPDPLKVYERILKPSTDELGNPVMLIRAQGEEYIAYKRVQD